MNKIEALKSVLGLEFDELSTAEEIYPVWKQAKEISESVEAIMKAMKDKMFSIAETEGTKDAKGGFKVVLGENKGYEKQARVSVSLLKDVALQIVKDKNVEGVIDIKRSLAEDKAEEALELLEQEMPDAVEKEEVINEGALEEAVVNGEISPEEFESMVSKKTTYALVDLEKKKKEKK